MSSTILQQWYDESCRIRGLIIDLTSKLEIQMDDFICQNLIGSYNYKIDFMKELFLESDVIYKKKTKIVHGILLRKYKTKAAYDKHYKSLVADLDTIGYIRNKLAHGVTMLPKGLDFQNYKIQLNKKNKTDDFFSLTEKEVEHHIKLIEKTKNIFMAHFNWKRLK